ncbi:MFS transporter [Qipengyuania sp. RANM35]|uniref:MFS transporter n=1 Tax=Qipengyuania sp. RANM35 TaxID=3068635 RepID=UPI0034DAF994
MTTAAQPSRISGIRLFWVVALLALSVLLNYVDRGAIGVAAPLMIEELKFSATEFGTAVSAFFWVYAPLCLFVGWLCDRFCVYRMFAAGIALWAVATLLTGFVNGLVLLIVLRLLLGLGESIAFPGSSKIFAAEVPAHHRGSANALIGAALAFGPAVGVLTGGAILEALGWRPIFWIFGLVTLVWLLPWHLASAPLRSDSVTTPVVDPVPMRRLFAIPTLWLMGIAHFMSNYGFYFLLAWLPLYLTKTLGYSIAEMTLLTTLSFTSQGIAALVAGRVSDMAVTRGADEARVRRWSMVIGQAMLGTAVAGIWYAGDAWALGAWLVVAGIGTGIVSVNLFAVAQIFAGARAAGGWVGIQNAIGNASGIVGPIITGVIVDQLGSYGLAFAIASGVAVFGAVWWWLVIPPIRTVEV